jgi:diphthamide synthase (EF-2-diphthine--ammonia ligase)
MVRGKKVDRSRLTSEAKASGVQSFGEFGEFEPL